MICLYYYIININHVVIIYANRKDTKIYVVLKYTINKYYHKKYVKHVSHIILKLLPYSAITDHYFEVILYF